MTATLRNRDLMGASQAVEVLAGLKYSDPLLRIRIAKSRRSLREQQNLVAPVQEQMRLDHALRDEKGQVVYDEQHDESGNVVGRIPRIDPDQWQEWNRQNEELLEATFEAPALPSAVLDTAQERDEKGKVHAWIPEPWIYDALMDLLEEPPEEVG